MVSNSTVGIIDYRRGNLFSVQRAIEHVGGTPYLISDAKELPHANGVILPGVGAFADAMAALKELGFIDALHAYAKSGKPLLGICLGMQMLFESSEEFGTCAGLGMIPGTVKKLADTSSHEFGTCKIPHVGWTALQLPLTNDKTLWQHSPLSETKEMEPVYFVHSYTAHPTHDKHRLADSIYFGQRIAAAVKKDNIIGMQYHPEKSGEAGLRMLNRFCKL